MPTTQQAADLLGVNRPTVIKLIDNGELPAETPETRRRLIKLDDVLACKNRRRTAQYALLAKIAVDDIYAPTDEPDVSPKEIERIRTVIAARRRNRASN